jgi:hypothetical protein
MLVPTPTRRVEAAPLPGMRSTLEVTNPVAGAQAQALGRATQQVGQGLEQAGAAWADHQKKERVRKVQNARSGVNMQAEKLKQDFMNLEKSQVTDEALQKYQQDIEKVYQDGMAGMDAEEVELYRQNTDAHRDGFLLDGRGHTIRQQKIAQREAYDTDEKQATISAGTDDGATGALNTSRALTLAYQRPELGTPEARMLARRAKAAEIAQLRVDTLIRSKRPEDAKAYLDRALADEQTDPVTGAKLHMDLDENTAARLRTAIDGALEDKRVLQFARDLDTSLRAETPGMDMRSVETRLNAGVGAIRQQAADGKLTPDEAQRREAQFRQDIGQQVAVRRAYLGAQEDAAVPAIRNAMSAERAMEVVRQADPEIQPKLRALVEATHPVTSGAQGRAERREPTDPVAERAVKAGISSLISAGRGKPASEKYYKSVYQVELDAIEQGLSAEAQKEMIDFYKADGEIKGLTPAMIERTAARVLGVKERDLKIDTWQLYQDTIANWRGDAEPTETEVYKQVQRNLWKGVYTDDGKPATFAEAMRTGRPFKPGPTFNQESWDKSAALEDAKRLGIPTQFRKVEVKPGFAPTEIPLEGLPDTLSIPGTEPTVAERVVNRDPEAVVNDLAGRRMAELGFNIDGVPVTADRFKQREAVRAAGFLAARRANLQALQNQTVDALTADEQLRSLEVGYTFGQYTGTEALVRENMAHTDAGNEAAPWLADYLSRRPSSKTPGATALDDYRAQVMNTNPADREAYVEFFTRTLLGRVKNAGSTR